MTCWLGSSSAVCTPIRITATLSDMSDCFSLLSSRSMFCYIGWMVEMMVMFLMLIIVFNLITLMMLALCML
jgi:hypothetical protein